MRPPDPPWNMQAAMILLSAVCIILGVWYGPLYAILPYAASYQPYTVHHVVFQLQLLLFSGLAFFLMLPVLKRTLTITLDIDWVWRRAGSILAEEFRLGWIAGMTALAQRGYRAGGRLAESLYRQHGPTGSLARTRPTGYMALWMALLLLGFMIFAFF